jgi:hypothetical protein
VAITFGKIVPVMGLLAALGLAVPAHAASDEADPVEVFNKVCYSQVPSVEAIQAMARELLWEPLEAADLKEFSPDPDPEVLEGWDVQVGKRFYRLGLARTAVSESFRTSFPEFAAGKATSCTLVLDGRNDAAKVAEDILKLAGKEPASRDVSDGAFTTTTWAGGNDEFKVFLISKAGAEGESGLLNVTILTK